MTKIAIIGGTGAEGLGPARRVAQGGGGGGRGKEAPPEATVEGLLNAEAVGPAEVVFLTVPWDAHQSSLGNLAEAIGEKGLVDVVVPMLFDRGPAKANLVDEGSAAQQARVLAPTAKVVSAFHHLDGSDLQRIDRPMQGDVLVAGDHKGAKKTVMDLVELIEYVRALDAGGLTNSRYLEEFTVLLLHLNGIYKARSGVRIVGV